MKEVKTFEIWIRKKGILFNNPVKKQQQQQQNWERIIIEKIG